MARAQILLACGITSRRELDHDAGAAVQFDAEIRRPYLQHLVAQQQAQQQPEGQRMATALAGRMDAWLAGM